MKVFEYAKLNNVSSAEIKKKFSLPSHLSVIPKEFLIETESKEDTGLNFEKIEAITEKLKEAPIPIETASKQAPTPKPILSVPEVPMEVKIRSCRGLGTKSPYWKELNA